MSSKSIYSAYFYLNTDNKYFIYNIYIICNKIDMFYHFLLFNTIHVTMFGRPWLRDMNHNKIAI